MDTLEDGYSFRVGHHMDVRAPNGSFYCENRANLDKCFEDNKSKWKLLKNEKHFPLVRNSNWATILTMFWRVA